MSMSTENKEGKEQKRNLKQVSSAKFFTMILLCIAVLDIVLKGERCQKAPRVL